MESNHRSLDVNQASSPLDHRVIASPRNSGPDWKKRKGQDSNLQGLSPRPPSKRVPSCLLARPSLIAVPAGLEPAPVRLTAGRTTVVLRDKKSEVQPHKSRQHRTKLVPVCKLAQ